MPGTRLLLGVGAILFLNSLLFLVRAVTRTQSVWIPLAGMVALLILFAWLPIQVRRRARERFAKLSEEERRGTYTFTEDGFAWTLGRVPGKLPWSAVTKIHDSEDYLFLLTSGARAHIIPKRSLVADERKSFESLVGAWGQ